MALTRRRAHRCTFVAALLAGCVPATAAPDGNLHIRFDITGRVQRSGVVLTHAADARHGCSQPRRDRLPTAQGPAPAEHEPPNIAFGYEVHFGPHVEPVAAGTAPDWIGFGPQAGFAILVPARPGALEAAGPVQIGRSFRITVGTREGLWERTVAEDEARSAASLSIAPDGLSGSFRVTGLVRQIPHNRLPDSESISVSGTWRCPAR
jgi:hypothetical protein